MRVAFTYVKSNYDVIADLNQFKQLYDFQHLGVVVDVSFKKHKKVLQESFQQLTNQPVTILFVNSSNFTEVLANAQQNHVDALYIFPLMSFQQSQIPAFFDSVQQAKLPSFAMLGRHYTEMGALASLANANYSEIQARRIALDTLKIIEGEKVATLPVDLPYMNDDFVVNMQTANSIGLSPKIEVLQQADLIKQFAKTANMGEIDFQQALLIALENNLKLQQAKNSISISENQIDDAKATFLPTFEVSYQGTKVDDMTRGRQGAGATQKLVANATQVLFSDQSFALYKARKLSLDANIEGLKRAEDEVIFDVLSGFVKLANARRQAQLQSENTQRTRINLSIAESKAEIGYAGKSDVYRLQSELASNEANLQKAESTYQQTQLALKKTLNIPLDDEVYFADIENPLQLLSLTNAQLANRLDNQQKIAVFTDYLVSIARQKRPSILQYDYNIEAQQQIVDADKRKRYMPTILLSANAQKPLAYHDVVAGNDPAHDSTWDVSLVAKLPLFDGKRKSGNKQNSLTLDKLKLERADLVNNISLGLRSDMQTARASYRQMQLFQSSLDSAKKNFELVESLYKYGQSNITNLIDAQHNLLATQLNALNAEQQLFMDYLKVEQQSGFYYFLATPEQQQKFVDNFGKFAQNRQNTMAMTQ